MDNKVLARYLELGDRIKRLESERASIRSQIVSKGSFATKLYNVTVNMQKRRALARGGVEKLFERFDARKLKGIITESEFPRVAIKPKKG